MRPLAKSQSSWIGAARVNGTRKQMPRCTSRYKPFFCFLSLLAPLSPKYLVGTQGRLAISSHVASGLKIYDHAK